MLHPSPPESPEEAFSSDENERGVHARARADRPSARSVFAGSMPSIEGFDDGSDDGSDHSGVSRLIKSVREVRAEAARLKNDAFFRESESERSFSRSDEPRDFRRASA